MGIKIHDGTSFKDVSNVRVCSSFNDNYLRVSRVWVHNGTEYVMVKGRVFEVEWELDMSDWMGATWSNADYYNEHDNLSKGMFILDSGDLVNLVRYSIDDRSTTKSGRYPLQVIRSDDGNISCWTSDYYSSYPVDYWNTDSNTRYYEESLCMCRCGDLLVFITEFGLLFSYNLDGVKMSKYYNSSWVYGGTSLTSELNYPTNNGIVSLDYTNNCLYFIMLSSDEKNNYHRLYRLGLNQTTGYFGTERVHAQFFNSPTEGFYCDFNGFVSDRTSSKLVLHTYSHGDSTALSHKLSVYSTDFTSSSTSTYEEILCESFLDVYSGETPIYAKNGYVYTYNPNSIPGTLRKYRISDLSLVWETPNTGVPYYFHSPAEACANGIRCEDYGDDAFILSNGTVVYFDGAIDRPPDWFPNYSDSVRIRTGAFNESLGIGYVQLYYSDYLNSNGLAVNKILKLKEVKK